MPGPDPLGNASTPNILRTLSERLRPRLAVASLTAYRVADATSVRLRPKANMLNPARGHVTARPWIRVKLYGFPVPTMDITSNAQKWSIVG